MLAGFYNVLKPPGMTSHDVVYALRRRLPRGTKVGHLGTLDPPAAGVLPLAVGFATRLISHLPEGEKAYLAEINFGWRSDTHDAAGLLQVGGEVPTDLEEALRPLLAGYLGQVLQVPPQVSALRQGGKRGYERVREGEVFELPARPALYREVRLLRCQGTRAVLRVQCGPGTYIRALARDLGQALGCGAILQFLLRLQSGDFHLPQAVCLEELSETNPLPWHWPWRQAPRHRLSHWPPPVQGEDGLAFHAQGVALYRQGHKVWSREGVELGP